MKLRHRSAAGICLAFASSVVVAQTAGEHGWYVGGSIGQSRVKISDNALAISGAAPSSLSKEETDTTYKVFGGYRFMRHLAVEAGWADFGSFQARRTVGGAGSVAAEIKMSGFFVDAVGLLPLQSNFSLFGKLGGIYSTTKTSLSTTGGVFLLPGVDRSPSKSELNLKIGFGASYAINRNVALRAELEHYSDLGDKNTGEGDVQALTVGVTYHF